MVNTQGHMHKYAGTRIMKEYKEVYMIRYKHDKYMQTSRFGQMLMSHGSIHLLLVLAAFGGVDVRQFCHP